MNFTKHPIARTFVAHGVEFAGRRGNQFYGTCPFTGKDEKFYVNMENGLWDSKTAGLKGNITTFLEERQKVYEAACDEERLKKLCRHRQLTPNALKPWHIGWTGSAYAVPVRDLNGTLVDIRTYTIAKGHKSRMMSTAGCKVGLLGAHRLPSKPEDPIYLCEGEWDAVAMYWLLRLNKMPGIALAVPGATIFKTEWTNWFVGRNVHTLYDHDEAGLMGDGTAYKRLHGVAKRLSFTHWPEELPPGFDLRDWVLYGVNKKKTPDLCLQRLKFLFKGEPRTHERPAASEPGAGKVLHIKLKRQQRATPTLEDVYAVFKKWLHLENMDLVDVTLAVALSQRIDGPPVWLFIVGPPGGAKTITMAALTDYEHSYSTSTLSSHALISGANNLSSGDPSLIPRLNGKVLVIKDFTPVLSMRDVDRDDIFGILRDAYDGRCGKVFGNGVERSYEARFTVVAAVTPVIYELGAKNASLGERFLKYFTGKSLEHESEGAIISRAIENVDEDAQMRSELASVTRDFMEGSRADHPVPTLPNDLHKRIIALARFGARLRGIVAREQWNNSIVLGRPFAEVGSRLGIQLAKLARALALVHGKEEVDMQEYCVVRKVLLDTVSQRNEDIIRALWKTTPAREDGVALEDLVGQTSYGTESVRRVLDDMFLLRIVTRKRVGGTFGKRFEWALSRYMRERIEESGVYADPATLGRKALRVRLPRPKVVLRADSVNG